MKIPPSVQPPPGLPGGAFAWAQARGLDVRHPEVWDLADRAAYVAHFGRRAPTRSPYGIACPCHPTRWRDPRPEPEFWEQVSDEDVAAWVAREPFVRGGLSLRTAQALTFIETFRPAAKRREAAAA